MWLHCLINAKPAYVVPAAVTRLPLISLISALSVPDRLPGLERLNHPGAARHPSLGRRGVVCDCIASVVPTAVARLSSMYLSFTPQLLIHRLFFYGSHVHSFRSHVCRDGVFCSGYSSPPLRGGVPREGRGGALRSKVPANHHQYTFQIFHDLAILKPDHPQPLCH